MGKRGVRSWTGRQVACSVARMGFHTEEHCGYKKARLLLDSVFWPTPCSVCFWLSSCSGLFPWSSLARQFYSILQHFQRAQLMPFRWTSSLGTVLGLCTPVACQIWCSRAMFGDFCVASTCETGIFPVCRRKAFCLT